MTHHSEQASANASTTHPTTKSHCPAGAGIINTPAAPEGSHTPPQACATPATDPACQPHSEAPHAQLAEGYKHNEEDDADMHIDPEDRADIERQHQAMCDVFSNLQDAILDGLIPFQDHAYRAGYKRATQHHAATASACATANEYCQQHGIGKWGESAVQALINDHKRLSFQLAHAHRQEQRLDDEITRLKATDEYYLQDNSTYVGNDVLWWKRNCAGYTTDLSQAHVFTKARALSQHKCRDTDIPWPKGYIDQLTRPAVDMQRLDRAKSLASNGGAR